MNAPENLPDFEYEHKHHTMKWCIYESDETDKLSFKADGVADGIYTVEVVGLRNPWGRYEHRHYYGQGAIVKDGVFVPQPTMNAIYYAQCQAEGGVARFDHVFIERLSLDAQSGLLVADCGS